MFWNQFVSEKINDQKITGNFQGIHISSDINIQDFQDIQKINFRRLVEVFCQMFKKDIGEKDCQ